MNTVLRSTATRGAAAAWREQVPILARRVHGKPLVYLDNAATAQRPQAVIDAIDDFYRRHNANVHRGVHTLSGEATDLFEAAREAIRRRLNAASSREIVFTRGTTEAINLVANSFLRPRLRAGDVIALSHMEHHSNIVPWQLAAAAAGAELRVIPVTDDGELDLEALDKLLDERVRMLALVHVSNALGTINPVADICRLARARDIPVLLDGAQAMPHLAVDVQAIGCDFYCCSAHKMYGPTGSGVLYGREALLEAMPPWQGGGEMIEEVRFSGSTWNALPAKFEAGTPNIAGAIGLRAANDWLLGLGLEAIAAHENDLLAYATATLDAVPGLRLIGRARAKTALVTFTLAGTHPHDLGTLLDLEGIAIRTGHHCAMPLMQRFGVTATARASFALYNNRAEIDLLATALDKARRMLIA